MNLKDKNIVYIIHNYTSFQKDQIELLSRNFAKVYVFVRYKPIAEISRIFPISFLKTHRKDFILQDNDKPNNIFIYLVPLWYFPTDNGYLSLGDKHFRAIDKIIEKENIKFDIIHSHFAWSAGFVGKRLKEKIFSTIYFNNT